MSQSLLSNRLKHFIDKTPEQLKKTLTEADTQMLHALYKTIGNVITDYPNSPSLTNLQGQIIDELMSREQKVEIPAVAEESNSIKFESIVDTDVLAMEFEDDEWLIDKIIPSTGFVMFVGEAGAGKSFLALDAVRALSTKSKFLDHFEPSDIYSSLVIDKENGLRRTQKRMKGMNMQPTGKIHFLKYPEQFKLSNEEFLTAVAELITKENIKLVILDSFIDVIEGNENSSGDTNLVFDALRTISSNVCFLLLHHDSKPLPKMFRNAGQKTRGSSNILAQVDNQFYLEKAKDQNILIIEQGKSRDAEPVKKFRIEFVPNEQSEMGGFKYLGEVEDEVTKVDEAADFIVSYLTDHPNKSRQDILDEAENIQLSKHSVIRAVAMLKEKNIIDSVPDPLKKSRKLFFISVPTDEQLPAWEDPNPNL